MLIVLLSGYPTGENDIYDIFLPPGTDECINAPGTFPCYSPDNPPTFAFCGYHTSVTFNGVGHALYTVEPYENVPDAVFRPELRMERWLTQPRTYFRMRPSRPLPIPRAMRGGTFSISGLLETRSAMSAPIRSS